MHALATHFARFAAGCALTALVSPLAGAQAQPSPPAAIRLQVDNDAFDFWMPAWDRPDEEYTSGVKLTYDGTTVPWWARGLASHAAGHCDGAVQACVVGSHAIGQDMYTPERHVDDGGPLPGSRPNAGWLYYESAVRIVDDASYQQFAVTVGATGQPSLARQTQTFFHLLAARYNRPIDWSRQIPFTPGLMLRYDRAARIGLGDRSGTPRAIGAEIQPRIALSAGNILTAAEAGAKLRAGIGLANPWTPASTASPLRFDVILGASVDAVAYNAFLDGTMFRRSPSVERTPVVPETELGVELSWRRAALGYRAVTRGAEYRTRTRPHSWASLIGEWRL